MTERLKLPEVARQLGVSEKTARRYVKAGDLPSVFVGNAYRVSEEDVERYLRQARVPAGGEPPKKAPAPPPPELEEPAGPDESERRRAKVIEDLAAHIRWRAGVVEQEVERAIPGPEDFSAWDGEEVHRWSSKLNREYRVYIDHRDKLKPRPGDEIMMLDGALVRFSQVLEAGRARSDARDAAWDSGAEEKPTEQARSESGLGD